MDALEKLYDITKNMHDFLQEKKAEENREDVIEKIQQFIGERESLLANTVMPAGKQFQRTYEEIVYYDKAITTKMHQVQNEIKKDLLSLKKGKNSFNGYQQVYQPVSSDGVFIDKRK